jgi:cobalamin biosynthesis protein CobW
VTVDGVIAVVDGPALASGKVASDMAALAAQRAADESLDHDDPVEEVFEDQIACADLIILSKADQLDQAGRDIAIARIAGHLPRAVKIVPSENGRVDSAVVLGLGLAVEDDIENRKTHHDGAFDHEHDDFDTFVLDLPAITDPEDLSARVTKAAEAQNVLRLKGFAEVAGKPMRLVVQAVGARVSHYFDRPWQAEEHRRTRLVVIGLKGLDRPAIEAILKG